MFFFSVWDFWLSHWKSLLPIAGVVLVIVALSGLMFFAAEYGRTNSVKRMQDATEACTRSGGQMVISYDGQSYRRTAATCVPAGVTTVRVER